MANVSCITKDEVRPLNLTNGTAGLLCLVLSLAGLVGELMFLCQRKNNFLLRLFIYLSVAINIFLATFASQILLYIDENQKYYQIVCRVLFPMERYSYLVQIVFAISISGTLL